MTTTGPVDFVIVTALPVERDAVLRRLQPVETIQEAGDPHTYYVARLDTAGTGRYRVVLTMLLGPGNYSAAASTTRLIQRWQPKYVLMVGIAGGVAGKVALGDVVVADFCYAYEQAKLTPGHDELRGQQLPVDNFLRARAQAYGDENWNSTIGVPLPSPHPASTAHFGPIASGEKVIADQTTLPNLLAHVPRLLAVEMEGVGVANALRNYDPAPGFFVVRGISDFANNQKNDQWHSYAANAAAAFTIGFLKTGPIPVSVTSDTPHRIGRYEIIRELGRGGMGKVYLARDPNMEREVAVKVLAHQLTNDPQFHARFVQEAKTLATLDHQCIVPIHDYGEQDRQPYIIMRHMSGGTLTERLARGPLSLPDIIPILQRVAEALEAAHQKNIIHRDVKPGNILFGSHGNAALADFGLAKLVNLSATISDSGITTGTPAYMSPEQVKGERALDGRSDIYSLGAVLYEMLTGQPPYKAESSMGVMLKHLNDPVPQIANPAELALPPECNAILARAMAKDPKARYASAGALARAVHALVHEPAPPLVIPLPAPELLTQVEGSIGFLHAVPAGEFLMGSRHHLREAPPHTTFVHDFEIAHIPVTVNQFAAFVDSGGYQQRQWWSEAGRAWREGRSNGWGRVTRSQPDDWMNQKSQSNAPVTGLTCYEAEAYCQWLGEQKHKAIRLPTEEEWEKAARGVDGRVWPWGNAFDTQLANTYEMKSNGVLPVEKIPGDLSPYGLRDMAGNVQEWTASKYRPAPDEEFPDPDLRVARGGSWNDTAHGARCAFRHVYPPGYYFPFVGFRIVVARQ